LAYSTLVRVAHYDNVFELRVSKAKYVNSIYSQNTDGKVVEQVAQWSTPQQLAYSLPKL